MSLIREQLTTSSINGLLANVPYFHGTFPADCIPEIKERPAAIIVNTDPDGEPGEHWTAIVLKEENKAIYFDPLGFPPLIESVQKFIAKNAVSFKYNAACLQDPSGVACGYWCAAFVIYWSRGGTLRSFSCEFARRGDDSDKRLDLWLQRNLRPAQRRVLGIKTPDSLPEYRSHGSGDDQRV